MRLQKGWDLSITKCKHNWYRSIWGRGSWHSSPICQGEAQGCVHHHHLESMIKKKKILVLLICALISNRRSWLMSLETPVLLPPSSQNHVCHPPQQATGLKLGRVPWKSRLLEIIRKTCFFLKNSRVAQGSVLHSDCLLVLKTHRDGFAFFWGGKIYKMITETHFFFLIFPYIRCASRYISRFIHGFKKAIDKWEK